LDVPVLVPARLAACLTPGGRVSTLALNLFPAGWRNEMRLRALFLGLSVVLLLGLVACNSPEEFDTYEDPTLEEILDIGKRYLMEGNGGSAAEAFAAALGVAADCPEAKYGMLIARNQQFISLMNELISFAGGAAQQAPSQDGLEPLVLAQETEPIGDYIQDFLQQSADEWYKVAEQFYVELCAEPNPTFEIEGFDMEIEGIIVFHFGGTLDRSDLQFFGVLNALVRAVADIALAHDLNYDFFSIQIPPLDVDLTNLELDAAAIAALIEGIDPIFQLIEDLLTYEDNPDFLTVRGEEGLKRMQKAGVELGQLFWRVHLMFEAAYAEVGAQPIDTVRFVDGNRDGRGDPMNEALFIPGLGTLDADLVRGIDTLAVGAAGAFWDTTRYDFEPGVINPLYIADATELLTALDILPLVIDADFLRSLGIDLGDSGLMIVIDQIPYILPIDVGPWFADPSPTGIKDLLWDIVHLWDLIADVAAGLTE
jgi:hypothetical protein